MQGQWLENDIQERRQEAHILIDRAEAFFFLAMMPDGGGTTLALPFVKDGDEDPAQTVGLWGMVAIEGHRLMVTSHKDMALVDDAA